MSLKIWKLFTIINHCIFDVSRSNCILINADYASGNYIIVYERRIYVSIEKCLTAINRLASEFRIIRLYYLDLHTTHTYFKLYL